MRAQLDAGGFGDRHRGGEERLQPRPQLVGADRPDRLVRVRGGEVHVPDLAARDLGLVTEALDLEADRLGAAARERAGDVAPDAREAEVVAQAGNAGLAEQPDAVEHLLQLLLAPRPVEQDVVPVAGIEVLDRVQRQALGFDGGAHAARSPRASTACRPGRSDPSPRCATWTPGCAARRRSSRRGAPRCGWRPPGARTAGCPRSACAGTARARASRSPMIAGGGAPRKAQGAPGTRPRTRVPAPGDETISSLAADGLDPIAHAAQPDAVAVRGQLHPHAVVRDLEPHAVRTHGRASP